MSPCLYCAFSFFLSEPVKVKVLLKNPLSVGLQMKCVSLTWTHQAISGEEGVCEGSVIAAGAVLL